MNRYFYGSDSIPYSVFKEYFKYNLSAVAFLANLKIAELELLNNLQITITDGYFLVASGQHNFDYSKALQGLFRNKDTIAERKKGFMPINLFLYSQKPVNIPFSALKVSAAPEYIEWAIKNVSGFFIHANDVKLLETSLCYKYVGLKVNRIDNNSYSFIPMYYSQKYLLDDETKEINTLKSVAGNKMRTAQTLNDDNKFNFNKYSGSYVQDVEGWCDEDIDNAFGGEADAYWNTD